jgi:CheY-like chemotaxis protein/anti-sigma regulatory factor (Ser/Thr protein kinase)
MAQVFSNLLNNAAKYSEPGGHIWLSAQREGGRVTVRIRDSGVGIPPEMLPRIFDMYTQVDSSLDRAQGGMGIGLTLVKRLVEMHGGSIEAHSEGPNRGSEFVVRLPVAERPSAMQTETGGGEQAAPRRSRRILVVDANHDSAVSLAMMLDFLGNEVRTAQDGLEAVDQAAAFNPELVLMDIGLPRLNGFDAARRMRDLPGGNNIVLVALTGRGREKDRRGSHEAGFDHHIIKPVDPSTLEKLLDELETTAPPTLLEH